MPAIAAQLGLSRRASRGTSADSPCAPGWTHSTEAHSTTPTTASQRAPHQEREGSKGRPGVPLRGAKVTVRKRLRPCRGVLREAAATVTECASAKCGPLLTKERVGQWHGRRTTFGRAALRFLWQQPLWVETRGLKSNPRVELRQ
eukprot:13838631-Alexandrium_andersonii.AAC.1